MAVIYSNGNDSGFSMYSGSHSFSPFQTRSTVGSCLFLLFVFGVAILFCHRCATPIDTPSLYYSLSATIMAIIFVYGTLKRGFYNYHLLADKTNGSSVFIGAAKLNEAHVLVTSPDYGIPCLLPLQRDKPSEGIQVCTLLYIIDYCTA